MPSLQYLQQFDKRQLFRFFVDGRFQKKCNGWTGFEEKEIGSVQALINGFALMVDNFDLSAGLTSHYIAQLHKVCMLNVETDNTKSSPGELRYLSGGMPIFSKSTTLENIEELLQIRQYDNTVVFNSKPFRKRAEELDAQEIFESLQKEKRLSYRPWHPEIDGRMNKFLQREGTLEDFYEAKHYVQMQFARELDLIVAHYNTSMKQAKGNEEKITIIGKVVRDLELLHPFPDGNCRTFACVLMNHLLMYHDFPPAIQDNPNLNGEVSYKQFEQEIVQGMERTRALLENESAMLFEYSITETSDEDNQRFLDMSSELIKKLDDYSNDLIYLTSDALQRMTSGKWINYAGGINFCGVGSHNTIGKGYLYYCFLEEWQKDNKDVITELKKVIKRGARAIVISDGSYARHVNIPMLVVPDVGKAMIRVASATRNEVNCDTVLVTGTVGKTGFKFQLHHSLKRQKKVHAFLNSINTKIPTLRSLSSLAADDDLEIIEVSVGRDASFVETKSHWVSPNVCVFTDMGPNHMDRHKTIENLVVAKASVIAGIRDDGYCIVNRDAELYDQLVAEIQRMNGNVPIFSFGSTSEADAYVVRAEINKKYYRWDICASIDGEMIEYTIPLFHSHAPAQSVGVLFTVKKLGYDLHQAAKDYNREIDSFESMGRLFRLHYGGREILFYDQSYRGAIQGMRSAFEDIRNFDISGRKVFVMAGSSAEVNNKDTKDQHTEIAALINEAGVDRLFTTGPFADYIHDNLRDKSVLVKHSDDLDELSTEIESELQDGDFLFIMGSGNLYLGRLSRKILSYGTHERLG